MFKPALTFVKEINFYSNIIPAIKHVEEIANAPQNERIDAFIHHFGSRISLDPSNVQNWIANPWPIDMRWMFLFLSDANLADADAILLLENVKIANYNNIDRFVGFDVDETLAVIKVLHDRISSSIFTFE